MFMNLIVEPEFQNKIPPLTEEEFHHLEELILADGKVKRPISVWNGIIVDGHHRWKIIQKHPELHYEIEELHFEDKWEAFDWMYKNQLGRRNLTNDQYTCIVGELYEARKHIHGGHGGNRYTVLESPQNRDSLKTQIRTSHEIGKELGISHTKVERAGQYAKGINRIREKRPEAADEILTGKKRIGQKEIREIGKANPQDAEALMEELLDNKPKRNTVSRPGTGATSENRKLSREVREIIGGMEDTDSVMEYTIDNLTEQIGFNADAFVGVISNLIMDHKDICDEHRAEVAMVIGEVIAKIEKIKERLNDGTQL